MTEQEAIEIIKKNWPDERYTTLREALEFVIAEIRRLREENEELKAALLNVRDRLQWGEAENAISKACEMIIEALKEEEA